MDDTINPKLIALAKELDEAKANYEELLATVPEHEQDGLTFNLMNLEDGIAAVRAVNLAELKLKARYVDLDSMDAFLPESIILDLLALDGVPFPGSGTQ